MEAQQMNTTNTSKVSRVWLEFLNRSRTTIAVETIILLLIGLIAIGGNLLVVISIYRNPRLRTITNYFVFSLAMTDILFPIMVTPLSAVSSIKSSFVFDREVCEFQVISSLSLSYVSITTIVLMAINRFVRVCQPLKYNKLFSKRASKVILGVLWMASWIIVILVVKKGQPLAYVRFDPRKIICQLEHKYNNTISRVLANCVLTVVLVFPFLIIVYCYFEVFKKIRQHKRNVAPTSGRQRGLGTTWQEINITWTLFAVLLGYSLTWIPVMLVLLASNIFGSRNLPRQIHMVVTYSGASSNAINPVIYGILNTALRIEYVKIIKCQ